MQGQYRIAAGGAYYQPPLPFDSDNVTYFFKLVNTNNKES